MTTALHIDADGRVGVRTGKVELGQGLHTALAQIVADGLGVALDRIQMLPIDTALSPDQGVTLGSLSVVEAGAALRQACADWCATHGAPPGSAPRHNPLALNPPSVSCCPNVKES